MHEVETIESLLREYDDCRTDVECQRIVVRLDAVRTRLHATSYMNGRPTPGAPDFACAIAANDKSLLRNSGETGAEDACATDHFALTPHQVFVKQFMRSYNGLLLYHGVGTGKTCTAITVAEAMLQQNGGPFRRPALVIMPKTLKSRFRRQVFDAARVDADTGDSLQCTGAEYLRMVPDYMSLQKDELQRRVDAVIAERYHLYTFVEFANHVQRMVDAVHQRVSDPEERDARVARQVRAFMSDRLVIIDEAHNLKTDEDSADKIVPPLVELALRHAHNCKLLLLTATPMFDRASEIVWLMNLLLLNDKRPLLDARSLFQSGAGDEETDGQDILRPGAAEALAATFRGYVSHVHADDHPMLFPTLLTPDVDVNARGSVFPPAEYPKLDAYGRAIPKSQQLRDTQLVRSTMLKGGLQHLTYQSLAQNTWRNQDVAASDQTERSSLGTLIEMSNIVYPAEEERDRVGARGLRACFVRRANGKYAYAPAVLKHHGEFLDGAHLGIHAPKLATVLRYVQSCTGIAFVYSRWLSSGLVPLAMALEHAGFDRYEGSNLLSRGPSRNARGSFRYVLLSGDAKLSPDNDRAIRAVNADGNATGDVVKVVLCSTVGTEGLDFKNIREMHLVDPWYNFSRMHQTIGRAVRRCSHVQLPPSHRNVTVYHHACVAAETERRESIDFRVYRIAEIKQRVVDVIQASMKANAVDCVLNASTAASYTMDIVTSQGTVVKNWKVTAGRGAACSCKPQESEQGFATRDLPSLDIGSALEDHVPPYARRIATMFRKVQRPAYAYDDLRDACAASLKDRFDERVMLVALQSLLRDRTLAYVGGVYVSFAHVQESPSMRLRLPPAPSREDATGDVFETLQGRIQAVRRHLDSAKGFEDALVDHAVDRLRSDELRMVVTSLVRGLTQRPSQVLSAFETQVLQSLRRSGGLVGTWPRIDYYFDSALHHPCFHHVLPSGDIVPCTRQQNQALLQQASSSRPWPAGYRAFMSFRKGIPHFKLWHDGKEHSQGYVCQQTSMLTTQALKRRIATLHRHVLKGDRKHVKTVMCDAYELVLRSRGEADFARPLHHYVCSMSASKQSGRS